MTNLQLNLYGDQYTFLRDSRRFTGLMGGIGSGKSIGGSAKAVSAALGCIGDVTIETPSVGMVTAPTYNILRDGTIPAFRDIAGDLIEEMNTAPPINATLINGSTIMFRTAEKPNNLRGPSINWWWGDEAAFYHKDVWRVMIGRLRRGGKLGYAWLTTTPKGRNWLYQEFKQKQREQYYLYKLATWQNPFIDADFYQVLAESYVGDFAKQELNGDFVAFEGLIYTEFDRDVHTRTVDPEKQWKQVIAGVDWGYANPGVILVFGVDGDGNMHGLHEEYQRRRQMDDWTAIAVELQRRFKIEAFYCDPAEPGFIQQFRNAKLNAIPAENAVSDGIQAVKARIVNKQLTFDDAFVNTFAEFEQYQWAENTLGMKDQPVKANDHAMDTMRYAVMGLAKPRETKIGRNPFYDG